MVSFGYLGSGKVNYMTLNEFKNLSNDELIDLFKSNNYCFENISRSLGNVSRETARREFIKRGIDYYKLLQDWKTSIVVEYNKSPKLCKHCKNPLPWEKRKNEYCSGSCAASENNKGVVRNTIGNVENLSLGWKKRVRNVSEEKVKELKTNGDEKLVIRSDRHNDRISRHTDYSLVEIHPGQCFICGSYDCESDFCKKHNFQQLMGFVKHLGFDSTAIGTNKVFEEFSRVRNLIYDLYWNQNLSCAEIGEKFSYPGNSSITKVFEHLEIPRKSFEESTRNAIHKGKLIPGGGGLADKLHQEWHTTWTGEDVFLRSSYETDYANWLDENQISYSVEELRIEYYDSQQDKTRIAIPDFYISSTNEIIEIKSDYTLDIQEMLDKFEAYKNKGYIPKLVLEGKEVDIYRIEEEIGEKRLNKIKNNNITAFKRNLKDGNQDSEISGE